MAKLGKLWMGKGEIKVEPSLCSIGHDWFGVGGGGYSPQILVGMCHSEVKNRGLRIELERKKCWAPEVSVKMRSGASSRSSSVKM